MNYDEFAFFNRQLAAMLREDIPLEGALRQLSTGMRAGPLRTEVEQLEKELSAGIPLAEAARRRQLPEMYRRMLSIGTAANDLPGVLTLVADHYDRANALWTRLKGLLVYPVLVVLVSLGLTALLSFTFSRFLGHFVQQWMGQAPMVVTAMWIPPILLCVVVVLAAAAFSVPAWRGALRWKFPGFKEASLAQLASALSLMLKKGTPLTDALAMAETMESATPAAARLAEWRGLTERGHGNPATWPRLGRPFPPLFLWLVQSGGTDLAGGFQKASEIYQARANYRIEMLLYGALPISVLLLGQLVIWQAVPLVRALVWMMNMLGDVGM